MARYGKARGRRIVPVVALLLSGGLLVAGINLATTAAVGIVLALSMGFAAASDGPFWAAAIDLCGEDAGAASGLMNSIENLGGFLSPLLTPAIAAHAGWKVGLYCASAFVMASVLRAWNEITFTL